MKEILYLAVPVFIFLLMIEFIADRFLRRKLYETRDTFASLAMGAGNMAVSALVKSAVVGLYFMAYEYRIFDLPNKWYTWVLLIFAEDFCYYWFHRIHHTSRLFWAAHVNHHSSQKYNFATALRQSWTTPVTGFIFWLPLPLLGFHPLMILTQQAISLIYQFWIHTEFIGKMGWFGKIFNTPSHHRVHHSVNPHYLDKNHAGIFIIWDKMFGTFEPEVEPPVYGLTNNINTFNPVKIAFHEWYAMFRDAFRSRNIGDFFSFLFRNPKWKPDPSL